MSAPVDVATLRELARSDGLSPATAGRLLDRLEALERVAEALTPLVAYAIPSASARYDSLADAFYRDTGLMAPGKSVALEMLNSMPPDDVVRAQWVEWQTARIAKLYTDACVALAALDEEKP